MYAPSGTRKHLPYSMFDPQLIFDRLQSDFGLAKLESKFIDREHGLDEIPLSRPMLFPMPGLLEAVA